jgi:hypothetical protein
VNAAATVLALTLAQAVSAPPGVGKTPSPDQTARFAIVIGNNQPETSRAATLRYADDDALATHSLLLQAGVDSVLLTTLDEDTHRMKPAVTPNAPPRGQSLDAVFDDVTAKIRRAGERGATTELLLFYSGHGDVDGGEGYVVLEDSRLTRGMLYALLARSPATRNHVFVDACKSYFLAFDKGPGGQRTSYAASFIAAGVPGQLANTGFVLSTSSDRDSHEWERYEAGILSHELRSALRGAADADHDGRITYAELGAFLVTANSAIPNARFRPDFMVQPPGRDLHRDVLRWDSHLPAFQLGDPAAARDATRAVGHVYVESARGERVLDAHPSRGHVLSLRLPDERPLFIRKDDGTAELVIKEREPVVLAWQTASPPEIGRKGALHLAFERLFAVAFGPSEVAAFERRPLDLGLADVPQILASAPPDRRPATVRAVSGWTAVGAGAAGIVFSALATDRYYAGSDASQRETDGLNTEVHRFNVASVVCYAVAVAAGATWLWITRSRTEP